MTTKEFKRVARLLKEAYKEIESEALKQGVSLLSPGYDQLISIAREKILESQGFTLEEYRRAKAKVAGFSQADLVEHVEEREEKLKELDERHIPTEYEIEEIAEVVAERIAKKYIVPPVVKHEIVKEVTIEKPQIIETTKVVREKYDDKKIKEEVKKLEDKINNLKFPKEVDGEKLKKELFDALQLKIKESTELMGMPDFRKLAMGLQGQIDDLKNSALTAETDPLSLHLTGGTMTGALVANNHGTATTAEVVNVIYGVGDPPEANTTPIGTIYLKYIA